MTTKYNALYKRMKQEQEQMAQISKRLPKEEKGKGSSFERYRNELRGILREIQAVKRELAC